MLSHAVSCCLMLSLSLAPGDGWKVWDKTCALARHPGVAPRFRLQHLDSVWRKAKGDTGGPICPMVRWSCCGCFMLKYVWCYGSFTAKHCEAMKSWIIHNNSGDQRTSHCINHHQPIKLWPEAVCLKSSSNISALLWRAEARTRTEDENGVSMSSPQAPKTRVPGCFLRLPSLGDFMWLQSQRSSKK